jgi:hypothetical protein
MDLQGHGRFQGEFPGDVYRLGQLEHDLEYLITHLKLSSPSNTYGFAILGPVDQPLRTTLL